MMLFTHSVVGATVISLFPQAPELGIPLALFSHYLTDYIPHWEYNVQSKIFDKRHPDYENQIKNLSLIGKILTLKTDILKILADFILGILFSLLIFTYLYQVSWWLVLIGVMMGVLPDIGQFIYAMFPRYFSWLQKFHNFFHSAIHLDDKPVLGLISQFLTLLFIVGLFIWLSHSKF